MKKIKQKVCKKDDIPSNEYIKRVYNQLLKPLTDRLSEKKLGKYK